MDVIVGATAVPTPSIPRVTVGVLDGRSTTIGSVSATAVVGINVGSGTAVQALPINSKISSGK